MIANRSMPSATVIPLLAYPDIGDAITRLSDAFGFTLRIRIGDHRAQVNAGDGAVVLVVGTTPGAGVMVRVDDVDAHYQRTLQSGFMRILEAPESQPYGERQYSVEDFAGHRWVFTQSIADVDPLEWGGAPGDLR